MKTQWIKKNVSESDWKNWYSNLNYCYLRDSGWGRDKSIEVGFCTFNNTSPDVKEMDFEDMRIFQNWAEANNYYPRPLITT